MPASDTLREAIELLQQLGLREYEAKCFAGLSRVSMATAKELAEISEVPRTRVYDAIRVLEAKGLVEIQHSNPQQFRAVPIDEATETLRDRYESHVERLGDALARVEDVEASPGAPGQEVWALDGRDAIETRTRQLVRGADEEVVLVLGEESLLTEGLAGALRDLADGVDLRVGGVTASLARRLEDAVPATGQRLTDVAWLGSPDADGEPTMGRLLLVDRSSLLVSAVRPGTGRELAVFGTGSGNGLVLLVRRVVARWLGGDASR